MERNSLKITSGELTAAPVSVFLLYYKLLVIRILF